MSDELPIDDTAPAVESEPDMMEALANVEWHRWLTIVILLSLSGCFSGLNLGVLGLDVKDLEMMTEGPYETLEDERIGRLARKVLPLRRRGNLLLCTILLGNVMVNSLLSILMADIAGGGVALVTSTALIVIFGEIVPQAICSRHGVAAGAYLSWLLWIFLAITFIIAYPIAAILDKVLGEEVGTVMTKTKMKKFFAIQQDMKMIEDQEGRILRATLDLSTRPISEVMIKIEDSYMLDINTTINREITQEIYTKGFSRIPVYDGDRSNICGVLMAKDLILFNPDRDQMTIKQLSSVLREIVYIDHTTHCLRVLSYFKEGGSHIAIVTKVESEEKMDPYLKKIGLITLEDIIEEILDADIEDEYEGAGKEERRNQKE